MQQAKLERIHTACHRELIDKRLVRKCVLHSAGRTNPSRPEWRFGEAMAHRVGVGEVVRDSRVLDDVSGLKNLRTRKIRQMSRQYGDRRTSTFRDVKLATPRVDGAPSVQSCL